MFQVTYNIIRIFSLMSETKKGQGQRYLQKLDRRIWEIANKTSTVTSTSIFTSPSINRSCSRSWNYRSRHFSPLRLSSGQTPVTGGAGIEPQNIIWRPVKSRRFTTEPSRQPSEKTHKLYLTYYVYGVKLEKMDNIKYM